MSKAFALCFLIILAAGCSAEEGPLLPAQTEVPSFTEASRFDFSADTSEVFLSNFDLHLIDTIHLRRGNGEVYRSMEKVQGILLKDLLAFLPVEGMDNHSYSSFLVTCSASDGYQILFSWNELFNADIGNHTYILMNENGQPLKDSKDGIMTVSLKDEINGRRNLRGLTQIKVLKYEGAGQ